MTSFLIAFVSLAVLLGVFAYVALPAASRLRRAIVSASLAVVLGVLFFGYSDMLGRPKSTRLEVLRGAQEARVLGTYLKEGQGIYLWLQLPGLDEPRYYELPWSQNTAKAMQEAIRQNADGHGAGVAMHLPFERGWSKEEEPKFYPLPQPQLPDKPGEQQTAPTMVYQAPEQGV
ncbi:MAG TPA: hypothetical protein VGB82_13625 [Alphaproteobacteria bacterium]